MTVNGIKQKPIEGVSMAYTFDKANAKAPSKRDTQYFEMVGNRGIYHDGWMAATTPPASALGLATGKLPDLETGYRWELYNISEGLFAEQQPRREDAGQAQGNAGAVSDGGREVQCLPVG